MNKILSVLIIFCIWGCSGTPETAQQNKSTSYPEDSTLNSSTHSSYREGSILHFSWKEKSGSHEIALTAIKDTTFHSSAWRILGFHRIFNEVPCDINGIYSPDSGFKFTLFDSKYNETGIGHIYMRPDKEWEIEITAKSKTQKYELSADQSFDNINIRILYEEDCSQAKKYKKNPKLVTSEFDTMCSKSQIFYPQFDPGNPIQALVFNKDSFFLLSGEENFYHEIFSSFFPLFSNDEYISFEANSYIYSGGAHGMPANELININKVSNQILKQADIIDTTRLNALNQTCKPFFKDQIGAISEWNFVETGFYIPQQVAILKEGLLFQYGIYEIGSYAQGMPQFIVPWQILKPYLKPEFRIP